MHGGESACVRVCMCVGVCGCKRVGEIKITREKYIIKFPIISNRDNIKKSLTIEPPSIIG